MKKPLIPVLFCLINLFFLIAGPVAHAWLVERVSLTNDGRETSGPSGSYPTSQYPAMTPDGRYVLFSSKGTNLVEGDTNGKYDLFLRDRKKGTTVRVNVSSSGAEVTDKDTYQGSISPDGRYAAFSSPSAQLAADANGKYQVYLRDTVAGTTTMISRSNDGAPGNNTSSLNDVPVFSADGNYIAYSSNATNLAGGVTTATNQIYLYDRRNGQTTLITKTADGTPGDGSSTNPVISGDGRYIAFVSSAKNLTSPALDSAYNLILLHDRQTGQTTLVSKSPAGAVSNQGCSYPGISRDGGYVVFHTYATNLVSGMTGNTKDQVYLYDVAAGSLTLITKNAEGVPGDNSSHYAVISPDGRYVAFKSGAQNLLADNTKLSYSNIFVYDRTENTLQVVNVTASGDKPDSGAYLYSAIAEGAKAVAFQSGAANLVPNDQNNADDIFVAVKTTDDWTISPQGQIGGWRDDLAVAGNLAALIEGMSLSLWNVGGETIVKRGTLGLGYEPALLTVVGNYVYLISAWDAPRFSVVDITDPAAPVKKGECEAQTVWGGSLSYSSGYVYHSVEQQGVPDIQVIRVSDPQSPAVVKRLGIPANGFTVAGGKLYAIGDQNGNKFWVYSLADPLNPVKEGEYSGNVYGNRPAMYVDGSRVYSAAEGNGVQIFNVSDPTYPGKLSDFTGSGAGLAKGVYAAGDTMYIVADNKVLFVNVANPGSPSLLGEKEINGAARVRGSGGPAYVMAMGDGAVQRVAFTGGQAVVSAAGESPSMASGLLADGDRLYVGSADYLWIMNIADPSAPYALAKDARWKNLRPLAVSADRLYGTMGSKAYVVDVTNPAAMIPVSEYTAAGAIKPRAMAGTTALLGVDTNNDRKSDTLEIVDYASPAAPVKRASLTNLFTDELTDVAGAGNLACVAGEGTDGTNAVKVYDVSTPSSPVLKTTLNVQGGSQRLWMNGNTLFAASIAGNGTSLEAFDLTDPAAPVRAGQVSVPKQAYDIKVVTPEGRDPIVLMAVPGGSILTYGYTPTSGTFSPGPECHSPHSAEVTVTPSGGSGYRVVSNDYSYGSYTQLLQPKQTKCCLTTEVMPAQAKAEGCTAAPDKVDPVACGGKVPVTATAKEPWVFKEWTGAAAGASASTEATATGSCSVATANFWKPTLTLGAGNQNPWSGQEFRALSGEFDYTNGAKNVPITHITLTANEVDDWLATGLTFHTSGTGNEQEDVVEARLYLGSIGGTLLGTKTFTADNGNLAFSFNVTIPKSTTVSMILVYDFKPERTWPCNDYSSQLDMSRVAAVPLNFPPGQKLPAPPQGVTGGPSVAKRGDTVISDGDRQYGEAEDPAKNKPLEKPLKARIAWQHPQSIEYIEYEITGEAAGAFLGGVLNQKKTRKVPNAEGYAEESMTLGTKKGQQRPYEVKVDHKNKGAACSSTYGASQFTEWGLGLDLATASQYDNPDNGDIFGTFLSNIQAENTFTLTIDMAPPNYATIDEVIFSMGGQSVTGTVVTPNKVYKAAFDMAAFQQPQKLLVTVKMTKDGAHIEQQAEYNVKCVKLPSWVNVVSGLCHPESFVKEFSGDDGGAYNFTFNYPTNFAWSDYVPSDVGFLGGLDNNLNIEFSANATYRVNETSTFGATIKGQPKILGKEFGLEGGLSGDFDANFAFLRGTGTIGADFSFDLPEKGFSKTFLIYGVPVTAAVDLSGNVVIFIKGSAVLNRQLEFEEVSVEPGTTVTGHITISLAAVFGLAKISATGSPSVTIKILMKYTSANGTSTTWSGSVVVPIKVEGSIFWGLGSAELVSTQLGPWNFPAAAGSYPAAVRPLEDAPQPVAPRLMATSSLAADGSGRRMSVWIDDTRPAEPSPNPDVFYRYYNGTAWSAGAPIIGDASPNTEWETDPAVIFLSNGTAQACWTANKGDKALNNLNDILAAQDIVCAVWNGTAWGTPVKVIDDAEGDGVVSLAYDPALNKSVAVWVHNAAPDKAAMNRKAWKLMYSVYDPTANGGAGGYSPALDVPGTATGSADQMPAVAADGTGNIYLVWARDDDGIFYTELDKVANGTNVNAKNLDSHIMWSKLGETGWSAPAALATGGEATRWAPSLAPAPGGSFLAVWAEKAPGKKRSIKYSVLGGGAWRTPGNVAESEQYMEDPKAVVDAAGKATVIWRGYAAGGKTALFSSTGNMPNPVWSEPRQITHEDTVQWQPTAVVGADNKVYTSWTGYDPATGATKSGTGFTGGLNVADPNPGTAALTDTYSAQAVDADGNQVYESLQVSVGVNIITAGSYKVLADLYSGGKYIARGELIRNDLAAGAQTFVLVFPGGVISNRGLDGPYSLKNVVVMDLKDSAVQTAFAAAPSFATQAYRAAAFIPGPLSLNSGTYQGTLTRATISVQEPLANKSATAKDQVIVQATSTKNSQGFIVTLEETGNDTGIFTGTVGFSTRANDLINRNILVADHDLLYVVYNDPQGYRWTESAIWRQAGAGLGDLNSDGAIDLADAILAIRIMAGMPVEAEINPLGMIDDKGKITIKEVIYILQKAAVIR